MDRSLTRREMLVVISYAGLELTGTFSSDAFGSEAKLRKAFKRLAKQDAIEALRTVGRLYLDSASDEGDIAALLGHLPDAESVDDAYWEMFEERVRADFRAGETVSVEGWVLSRSECRLYGLLSLLGS